MRLHPLQIPGGWTVVQNHFYDITPSDALDGDRLDFPFVEDILQLTNDHLRMTLDLGWYPHGDPSGNYRLLLIQWDQPPEHSEMPKKTIRVKRSGIEYSYTLQPFLTGDAWSNPLVDVSSRDPNEIAANINSTLAMVEQGQIGMS